MTFLTRSDILSADDYKIEEIHVDEWNGPVGIRTFDAATRARLLQPAKDGKMPDNWMEMIVAASACDEFGKLIFSDDDVAALSNKNAVVLEKLFTASIELNGLTDSSRDKIQGESKPILK